MEVAIRKLYRVRFISRESEFVIANNYSDVEFIIKDGIRLHDDEIVSIEQIGKCYTEI